MIAFTSLSTEGRWEGTIGGHDHLQAGAPNAQHLNPRLKLETLLSLSYLSLIILVLMLRLSTIHLKAPVPRL